MFKVVVPSYNSFRWIEKTLGSLASQTFKKYDVCVVNDASPEEGYREKVEALCSQNGWESITNETRRGALFSAIQGVKKLECDDEDVIVIIDGDDWLFNEWTLEHLAEIYKNERPLITYGSYVNARSAKIGVGERIPKRHRKRRIYRKHPWVFSHLRTFSHLLWKNIQDEDLRAPDGEYFTSGCDLAAMYPMLEMAGLRIRYIPELLYVYNDTNPASHFQHSRQKQIENETILRTRKKYKVLDRSWLRST